MLVQYSAIDVTARIILSVTSRCNRKPCAVLPRLVRAHSSHPHPAPNIAHVFASHNTYEGFTTIVAINLVGRIANALPIAQRHLGKKKESMGVNPMLSFCVSTETKKGRYRVILYLPSMIRIVICESRRRNAMKLYLSPISVRHTCHLHLTFFVFENLSASQSFLCQAQRMLGRAQPNARR